MTEARVIRARKARRKALRRWFFPRGLSFTREGKIYVLVTLGVGFAAVNTGNNLLFLVLGLLLGLIIVSGVMSELVLRHVTVTRAAPRRVEAGLVFPVELGVGNDKRRVASFGLELRDEIDGEPFRRRCFFLRVGPRERRAIPYRCELPRRGPARFDGVLLTTRYPFGLFEKSRFIPLVDEILVWPAREAVELPRGLVVAGDEDVASRRRGAGQEFLELRELHDGDDPRRIHWPSTARLGRPVVRETEAEGRGFVEIVLDPAPEDDSPRSRTLAERRLGVASTLVQLAAAEGLGVRLTTVPALSMEVPGGADVTRLGDALALLDLDQAARSPAPVGRGPACVLIGPRARAAGGTAVGVEPPEAPR